MCPDWMLGLYIKLQMLAEALLDERGQDLIEYVLVASLISLAAMVGVKSVATAVGTAFTNIGTKLGVFEPSHGSAPKYAGQYKVNPIATILAAKMMVDWLGEKAMASKVESAVAAVIEDGKIRTYDMRGSATTLDMARAIAAKL